MHHHIGQKNVVYYCTQKCRNQCKCVLEYSWDRVTGVVDFENPIVVGEHTRPCAVFNNIPNLDTYEWNGKTEKVEVRAGKIECGTARLVDVTEDMALLAGELATGDDFRTKAPLQVWYELKRIMEERYGNYIGHSHQYILDRV